MKYGDPQKQSPGFYGHPFFGQIFLGTLFKIIGYPDAFIAADGNIETVNLLYMVPRIIMGLLAVLDTFIVFKIIDIYYGRKVAFIGSILFAVLPITWLLRWILLDNLLMPFLLSSLFIAIHATKYENIQIHERRSTIQFILILISGIFLGLAIFTKIPAFTMIPLFIYLLYSRTQNKGIIILWLMPVILIPLTWPLYAIRMNQFDDWVSSVLWQAEERIDKPLADSILRFFEIDPVLLILGFSGLAYTILRRDYFLILWAIPFLVFTLLIHYVSLFHLVFILPPLCIAGGKLIVDVYNQLRHKRIHHIISISAIVAIIF
jgi:4-amino-4-deoxy-L-arabinose transferase-like glycosyltransferase